MQISARYVTNNVTAGALDPQYKQKQTEHKSVKHDMQQTYKQLQHNLYTETDKREGEATTKETNQNEGQISYAQERHRSKCKHKQLHQDTKQPVSERAEKDSKEW